MGTSVTDGPGTSVVPPLGLEAPRGKKEVQVLVTPSGDAAQTADSGDRRLSAGGPS